MSQIEQVVRQIQSEFRLDANGQAFASIRGAARLADIDHKSLTTAFQSGEQKPSQLAEFLMQQGIGYGEQILWLTNGIPDKALALILEYYAHETQPRYRTEQAKLCCRAFNSIGIRSWLQKSLKWEQAGNTLALMAQKAIAEAEAVVNWVVESLGVDETFGKQMKVDMVANQLPHLKSSLEPIKKLISASDPLESVGMNATQVGEHLNPVKKAKEVNDLLEEMGLQYKVESISTKTGKSKYFWQVTEEGQKHSVVHKVTNSNTDWNGNQIKWQKSVVELIQEHLDNGSN